MVLEKTLESPLDCKEIQPVHPKGDQSWVFIARTDAEAETPILWPPDAELTHWKRPWCWEELGAGGEGDDRGWDSWMALPTWCTWVWVNSRSWWWTGRPGMLQFMGSQRVGHDWVTELNAPPPHSTATHQSAGDQLSVSLIENYHTGVNFRFPMLSTFLISNKTELRKFSVLVWLRIWQD